VSWGLDTDSCVWYHPPISRTYSLSLHDALPICEARGDDQADVGRRLTDWRHPRAHEQDHPEGEDRCAVCLDRALNAASMPAVPDDAAREQARQKSPCGDGRGEHTSGDGTAAQKHRAERGIQRDRVAERHRDDV